MLKTLSALTLCASIAISVTLCSAGIATAQPQCDQRDSVLQVLEQKYKEAPVAIGVTRGGGLIEVLSTGDGSTFSIIVTAPDGLSCLVAAGEGWRAMQAASVGPHT